MKYACQRKEVSGWGKLKMYLDYKKKPSEGWCAILFNPFVSIVILLRECMCFVFLHGNVDCVITKIIDFHPFQPVLNCDGMTGNFQIFGLKEPCLVSIHFQCPSQAEPAVCHTSPTLIRA